jgi:hypothetical protein
VKYRARANLTVDGTLRPWGAEWEQDPTADTSTLVVAGLLVEAAPDGSFPEPAPDVRPACCGRG